MSDSPNTTNPSSADDPPSTARRVLQPARWRSMTSRHAVTFFSRIVSGEHRFPWFPVVTAIVVIAVGFWTRHAVNESLTTILKQRLEAVLDTDMTALEIWIESERNQVRSWAGDVIEESLDDLQRIARESSDPRKALLESQPYEEVQQLLSPIIESEDHGDYMVLDRSGLVLVTGDDDDSVGRRLAPEGMAVYAAVLDGSRPFFRPPFGTGLIEGAQAPKVDSSTLAVAIDPELHIGTRLRNDAGEVIGALLVRIDPDREFTRILAMAQRGETDEVYAFDKNGYMLSRSRFETALQAAGVLPASEGRVNYAMQLRDPGGELLKGFKPDGPATSLPFTKMAASAIAGVDGVDIDGYRDYRGVEVIGAWRWIDRYGFGMAVELDVDEAFRALRPLNLAFTALIVMLTIGAGAILLSTYSVRRLSRKIDEVQQLGQYKLEKKIGEGGMGSVYLASHAMLLRPTALKLLKQDALSEDNVARFEREVQLTSQLTHPNTIEIYDYGRSPEGIFYYAMEYLPGVTLAKLVELTGAVLPARVIYILKRVCASLEEAHSVGLVHRDIKPLNIMLSERGVRADVVKVLDFGLVKDVSTPAELQVTAPDVVGGTPPYIAPERLKNPRCIDPRSDIFAVGAMAFNLLTASELFEGESTMEICYKVLHADRPRPSERVSTPIPAALEELVISCLAGEPEDRPQSMTEILAVFDTIDDAGRWGQPEARQWWADNRSRIDPVFIEASATATTRRAGVTEPLEPS